MSAARDDAALDEACAETSAVYRRYERPPSRLAGAAGDGAADAGGGCLRQRLADPGREAACLRRADLRLALHHRAPRGLPAAATGAPRAAERARRSPARLRAGSPRRPRRRARGQAGASGARLAARAPAPLHGLAGRRLPLPRNPRAAGGATYTNVNKHLTRAHARLRELAEEASEPNVPGPDENGGVPMTIGTCRRDGCANERRMRRGHRGAALRGVLPAGNGQGRPRARRGGGDGRPDPLPQDEAGAGRPPSRTGRPSESRRWPAPAPGRSTAAREPPAGRAARQSRAGSRTRCISEELLREARRLYGLGLSLRAVAETLLDQTRYASANSAEVALRFQFKRRGWPLRTRAQARRARRQR